jgi:uroporphyrin-3 C-methyltransferase
VNEAPLIESTPVPVVPTEPVALPRRRWPIAVAVLLALVVAASLALGWSAQKRVQKLESELVRRQQDSQNAANEARLFGKRAEESARESAAKVALLEARLSEVTVQRGQLDELIQSMSRSRDENTLVDIDAGLRVAQQQANLTGSAEPLLTALKSADERLQRASQPRLEGVRRAIARDIERVKSVGVPDVATLTLRLDEAIRLVDELPLLSQAEASREPARPVVPAGRGASAPAAAASAPAADNWWAQNTARWRAAGDELWNEVRSLIRVTRIDHPDAMLLAPEQAFFLRENLKLRLLNARLALLSRQYDTVQSDLQQALASLERHFDRGSRRTTTAVEAIRQVTASARKVGLPRPDDTFAALAAAGVGR